MAGDHASEKKDVSCKVMVDLCLVTLVAIPIALLKFVVTPHQRGFFCDDQSLMHPLKEDTIPTWLLVVTFGFGSLFIMIFLELFLFLRSRKRYGIHRCGAPQRYYSFFNKDVHVYLVTLYEVVGAFFFGGVVCQAATDILKYNLGRLRPNFIAICQPDWSKIECQDDNGFYRYVEDIACNETDTEHLQEARLSHPSGHASFSFYCTVYLVLYLQIRLKWYGSKLLCPFLQAMALYGAIWCCTTRVADYWHHWSDVLGGAILGTVVALLVVMRVSVLFKMPKLADISKMLTELQIYYHSSPHPTSRQNRYGDDGAELTEAGSQQEATLNLA